MKHLVCIIALITSFACGSARKANHPNAVEVSALSEKVSLYEQLQDQDSSGFIMTEKCDSLFFSGLLGAARPGTVDIEAARSLSGISPTWHLRPAQD